MRCVCILLFSAGALMAQVNARDLVRQSIENGRKAWRKSFDYSCTKSDINRQLDAKGHVRNVDDDVYQEIPLGHGSSFELHVKHDNEPVASDERAKQQADLARRRGESVPQKEHRFQKESAERSYMKEVADAFNFRITGQDNLPTGPAWVVEATPRPGYQPHSRYAHMFPYMRGTLWIDKKDVQWVKADAVATNTVTFGFFIARLAKGSHILIEQKKLPDGDWVPSRIDAKASARTFIFFNHRFDEDITYNDYRLGAQTATATRAKR